MSHLHAPEPEFSTWDYLQSLAMSASSSSSAPVTPAAAEYAHPLAAHPEWMLAYPAAYEQPPQPTVAPSQLTAAASPITPSSSYSHSPAVPFPRSSASGSPQAPSRRTPSSSHPSSSQPYPPQVLRPALAPNPQQQAGAYESTVFLRQTLPSGRQRIEQACEKCRERKAKCNGTRPSCQRCTNRGLACVYAPERRMRGPNRGGSVSGSVSGRKGSSSSTSSSRPPRPDRSSLSSSPTESTHALGSPALLARKFASTPQLRSTPSYSQQQAAPQPSPLARPAMARGASYALHPQHHHTRSNTTQQTHTQQTSNPPSVLASPAANPQRPRYSVENPPEPEDYPVPIHPPMPTLPQPQPQQRPELGLAIPTLPPVLGYSSAPPSAFVGHTRIHMHGEMGMDMQQQQQQLQYPPPPPAERSTLYAPSSAASYPVAAYYSPQLLRVPSNPPMVMSGPSTRSHTPTHAHAPTHTVSLDSPTSSSSYSHSTQNSRISPLTDLHAGGGGMMGMEQEWETHEHEHEGGKFGGMGGGEGAEGEGVGGTLSPELEAWGEYGF